MIDTPGVFHFSPGALGAQQRKNRRRRRRVTQFLKNPLHPRKGDGWKKVLQVEIDDRGAAHMRRGVGERAPSWHKSVRCVVRWNLLQDVNQNPFLRGGHVVMRCRKLSHASTLFRNLKSNVM